VEILNEYTLIKTQVDLEYLLDKTEGFHDSVIKEVVMLNNGYVIPESHYMYEGEFLFNARILVQTQREDIPAVELLAENVSLLAVTNATLEISGTVESDDIILFLDSSQSLCNAIKAQCIRYKFLDNDFLGKGPFLFNWPLKIGEYGDIEVENSGFIKLVINNFAFLTDEYGMKCSHIQNGTWIYSSVKYSSNAIELKISHERCSIDLTIKYIEPEYAQYGRLNFYDYLPVLKENAECCGWQAASEERIDKSLCQIADLIRKYSDFVFNPSHEFLSRIKEYAAKQAEKYATNTLVSQALSQSEKAWENKNFAKFIKILEPVEQHLTGSVLKKLEYARKKLEHGKH